MTNADVVASIAHLTGITNADLFTAHYIEDLTETVRRNPNDYALGGVRIVGNTGITDLTHTPDTPETYAARVATKMVQTILQGGSVNVSDSMRRVAKKLGIPKTIVAIYAFIRKGA